MTFLIFCPFIRSNTTSAEEISQKKKKSNKQTKKNTGEEFICIMQTPPPNTRNFNYVLIRIHIYLLNIVIICFLNQNSIASKHLFSRFTCLLFRE